MTTDSVRRQELIDEYQAATTAHIELARKYLREVKELLSRFLAEDKAVIRRLRACEEKGEELGLFAFVVTERIDVEEFRQPFEDHLESVKEDIDSFVDLRKEAQEADEEDGDEDDDEDLVDEDGSPLEDDDD